MGSLFQCLCLPALSVKLARCGVLGSLAHSVSLTGSSDEVLDVLAGFRVSIESKARSRLPSGELT